ncbi:GNAT family N-acetyltransferase [Leptospira kirschneri]|uniref:Acetyltransferase, GNAT family n=1 Tax=Leptospira kirschneri str. 200802841 TaxID=1193047 RepID=A0A828Y9G2_9LEPT|nr:GNAT family N-acetyltransferase [Leptospira kirschneri]EMO74273.1 acetyltransferase, GNAT family [Leptospira kirschneri str. 200801925]EKO52364.1 acetyltransferase, GNAT family [Leptospira kirschneri str. 200802841]EKQ84927.1 acetyltransferase, GNAT family [Leptospira kirschneri serovar Grippotyphosa str. Moskva]EKR09526.1 acetyltransferase, GNAT family [Leptospira kirschneri serovar Valbuzzi str. 200702274]EMK02660.1 acetyltransferase, GNAT family [Leptospira kirschneri str. MMD1493]
MNPIVIHSELESKFYAEIDGFQSYLFYREEGDGWNLISTYVPSELRGKGLAAELVRTALDKARSLNKKIIPSCSYVVTFLNRNPTYNDLITK